MLGLVYYYAKRYDLATEQLKKAIEFESNFWWAHTYLARIYEKTGNISAAITKLEQARKMEGATTEVSAALGHAYASTGKREEALKIISELNEPSNHIQMDGYEVAIIYAALGEKDQAFAYLDKEYATGSWFLLFIKVDPDLDPLRDDARFKDLLKRINLPE
jgi:tetratricopeptide (TPR) repeat protein